MFLGVNTELLDTLLCPEQNENSNVTTGSSEAPPSEGSEQEGATAAPLNKPVQSYNALLISKLTAIATLSCRCGGKLGIIN